MTIDFEKSGLAILIFACRCNVRNESQYAHSPH